MSLITVDNTNFSHFCVKNYSVFIAYDVDGVLNYKDLDYNTYMNFIGNPSRMEEVHEEEFYLDEIPEIFTVSFILRNDTKWKLFFYPSGVLANFVRPDFEAFVKKDYENRKFNDISVTNKCAEQMRQIAKNSIRLVRFHKQPFDTCNGFYFYSESNELFSISLERIQSFEDCPKADNYEPFIESLISKGLYYATEFAINGSDEIHKASIIFADN